MFFIDVVCEAHNINKKHPSLLNLPEQLPLFYILRVTAQPDWKSSEFEGFAGAKPGKPLKFGNFLAGARVVMRFFFYNN